MGDTSTDRPEGHRAPHPDWEWRFQRGLFIDGNVSTESYRIELARQEMWGQLGKE